MVASLEEVIVESDSEDDEFDIKLLKHEVWIKLCVILKNKSLKWSLVAYEEISTFKTCRCVIVWSKKQNTKIW